MKTTTLQKLFTSTRHRFVTLLVASAVIASAHAAVPRQTVIDGSFNPDTLGFDVYSLRVAVQANGKIVIAGAGLGGNRSMISRLNEDGSADASFRLDPAFHSAVSNVQSSLIEALAIQADGKILAAESLAASDRTYSARVLRLNRWDSATKTNVKKC